MGWTHRRREARTASQLLERLTRPTSHGCPEPRVLHPQERGGPRGEKSSSSSQTNAVLKTQASPESPPASFPSAPPGGLGSADPTEWPPTPRGHKGPPLPLNWSPAPLPVTLRNAHSRATGQSGTPPANVPEMQSFPPWLPRGGPAQSVPESPCRRLPHGRPGVAQHSGQRGLLRSARSHHIPHPPPPNHPHLARVPRASDFSSCPHPAHPVQPHEALLTPQEPGMLPQT